MNIKDRKKALKKADKRARQGLNKIRNLHSLALIYGETANAELCEKYMDEVNRVIMEFEQTLEVE